MNPNSDFETRNTEKVERVNPWLAIWFQTSKALRHAWAHLPEEYIHRHFMLAGLLFMLAVRVPDWLAFTPNPIGVMIQVLLVGPVGGIMVGYLYSACLRMVGRWMGQDVPSKYVKCFVAWTQLPFALFWGLFLGVYWLLNASQSVIHTKGIWLFQDTLGWLPLLVAAPVFIWGIVVRIKGISTLLGFKASRAAVVWLVTFVIAYIPASAFIVTYAIIYYVTATGG